MANNRTLRFGERAFSSPQSRDRVAGRRAIEGLGQNDQMIALLAEQNDMLRYLCDAMYGVLVELQKPPSA